MDKYEPLKNWLLKQPGPRVTVSFDDIEDEDRIGVKLPPSAREHRSWWGNEVTADSRQCRAWLDVGWRVDSVDLSRETVIFVRVR